ncbi:hypothetical protein H0H93_000483 [Arthromyces matolae]|nr:hypothetical protein H0H93_000483 [Arthromyces matolae]
MASLYSPSNVHTADNYQLPENFGLWPKDWELPMSQQDQAKDNNMVLLSNTPFNFSSESFVFPPINPEKVPGETAPATDSSPATDPPSSSHMGPSPSTQAPLPTTESSESSLPNMDRSPLLNLNPDLKSSDPNTAVSITSRSGRTITPLTRNEKLNQIGVSSSESRVADGKENIDPNSVVPPAWLLAAREHFLARDLGNDWKVCIDTWERFEASLNYHNSKGLPCAKERPSEWSQWVSKSHRSYRSTPVITDPMEFGLATVSWWKKIQPSVRQASLTELPVPIDECQLANEVGDVWAPLRKGGPNGMIIMVTLLSWWGQRLQVSTQWQEDSRPLWQGCVDDVRRCLEALIQSSSTVGPRGSKRKASDNDATNHKRAKLD